MQKKCSEKSMEVYLPTHLGNYDQLSLPNWRQTGGLIEKLNFSFNININISFDYENFTLE